MTWNYFTNILKGRDSTMQTLITSGQCFEKDWSVTEKLGGTLDEIIATDKSKQIPKKKKKKEYIYNLINKSEIWCDKANQLSSKGRKGDN